MTIYIIAGVLMFCAFAALQFWASKNGLSRSVRVMPLTIALIAVFICLMMYTGAFGGEQKPMLGFKASELYGLAFGIVSLCALAGDIVGWLAFKITNKKAKPQPKKKNKKKK